MKLLTILFLLVLINYGSVAFASGTRGGGFAIECVGQPLMILDYYEATLASLAGKPHLLSLKKEDLDRTKKKISERLLIIPNFHQMILFNFMDIIKTEYWIISNLDINNDDTNIPYKECKRKFQIAYRQFGTVYLKKDILSELSLGQLYVLSLHEFFYASSAQNSSESTRHVIRELLKIDSEFSQERLNKLTTELLSKWSPLVINIVKNVDAYDFRELDKVCKENGAEFATRARGKKWIQPNCIGQCTRWVTKEITCAHKR